jgi:hypothetical protein
MPSVVREHLTHIGAHFIDIARANGRIAEASLEDAACGHSFARDETRMLLKIRFDEEVIPYRHRAVLEVTNEFTAFLDARSVAQTIYTDLLREEYCTPQGEIAHNIRYPELSELKLAKASNGANV